MWNRQGNAKNWYNMTACHTSFSETSHKRTLHCHNVVCIFTSPIIIIVFSIASQILAEVLQEKTIPNKGNDSQFVLFTELMRRRRRQVQPVIPYHPNFRVRESSRDVVLHSCPRTGRLGWCGNRSSLKRSCNRGMEWEVSALAYDLSTDTLVNFSYRATASTTLWHLVIYKHSVPARLLWMYDKFRDSELCRRSMLSAPPAGCAVSPSLPIPAFNKGVMFTKSVTMQENLLVQANIRGSTFVNVMSGNLRCVHDTSEAVATLPETSF